MVPDQINLEVWAALDRVDAARGWLEVHVFSNLQPRPRPSLLYFRYNMLPPLILYERQQHIRACLPRAILFVPKPSSGCVGFRTHLRHLSTPGNCLLFDSTRLALGKKSVLKTRPKLLFGSFPAELRMKLNSVSTELSAPVFVSLR